MPDRRWDRKRLADAMVLAAGIAFLLEFGVFFGGILALAGWELYRTHKISAARKAEQEKAAGDKP